MGAAVPTAPYKSATDRVGEGGFPDTEQCTVCATNSHFNAFTLLRVTLRKKLANRVCTYSHYSRHCL